MYLLVLQLQYSVLTVHESVICCSSISTFKQISAHALVKINQATVI